MAEPGPVALASPLLATMVATEESDELHVIPGALVASSELPSLKIATARIWELVLSAILSTGTTLTFEIELASTVAVVVSLAAPMLEVMSALPRPTPVKRPVEVTRAIAGFEEIQAAVTEMSCFVPSSKVPVATNC